MTILCEYLFWKHILHIVNWPLFCGCVGPSLHGKTIYTNFDKSTHAHERQPRSEGSEHTSFSPSPGIRPGVQSHKPVWIISEPLRDCKSMLNASKGQDKCRVWKKKFLSHAQEFYVLTIFVHKLHENIQEIFYYNRNQPPASCQHLRILSSRYNQPTSQIWCLFLDLHSIHLEGCTFILRCDSHAIVMK